MLYTSGNNLESSAIEFVESNENITLYSAYLKLKELEKINASKNIKRIIVRWEIQDLCLEVSDIYLYEYCRQNNITLYRNTRLHLKAFWNNKESVLFGSANVTNRGLGEVGDYNYELNGKIDKVNFPTIQYFNKVILESELVTEELYNKLKDKMNEVKEPEIIYPSLKTLKSDADKFLLSDLPMCESVELLFKIYVSQENYTNEELSFAAHDLALYDVPLDLQELEFIEYIKIQFNSHPFISQLKEMIMEKGSVRYGSIVNWIQENTTTVPTPRNWELKKDLIVNILYDWICYFDSEFNWSRPNHSQVIFYENLQHIK